LLYGDYQYLEKEGDFFSVVCRGKLLFSVGMEVLLQHLVVPYVECPQPNVCEVLLYSMWILHY
jgi:hypothetical protein